MNKERRKAINEAYKRLCEYKLAFDNLPDLEEIKNELEALRDEEQEYKDNMPDSLQDGEKGNAADEAISHMEEALQRIEEITDGDISYSLERALEDLDNAGV